MPTLTERLAKVVSRVAMEFPTKEALEKYLDAHPKADKSKHRVKETQQEAPKQEEPQSTQTTPPGKGGFVIPKHKLIDIKAEGDLSNLDNWKAKIVLGNSMTKDKKKGDYDDVGYVAISTTGDDIIPIARSDEHEAGHELLWHLGKKGALKGKPQDYITLFPGGNYPEYAVREDDMGKYVGAIKKWLAYGGENVPIISVRKNYTTDMEEFVSSGGKIVNNPEKPTKPAREIMDFLDKVNEGVGKGDKKVVETAKALMRKLDYFRFAVQFIPDEAEAQMNKAIESGDVAAMAKPLKGIVDDLAGKFNHEYEGTREKIRGMFGSDGSSEKRLKAMSVQSGEKESEKGEKPKEEAKPKKLTEHAQETVSNFEETAKAAAEALSNPMAEKRFMSRAKALVQHLQTSDIGIDVVSKILDKAEADIANEDMASLQQHLFAFDGVKNFLHNYLRELKKRGEKHDKYFGDVDTALEEFNRLGQI